MTDLQSLKAWVRGLSARVPCCNLSRFDCRCRLTDGAAAYRERASNRNKRNGRKKK